MSEQIEENLVPSVPKLKGRPKGSLNKKTLREMEHHADREAANFSERDKEHDSGRKRTRSKNAMLVSNPHYLPIEEIPEGLSYEWKRYAVVGEEDQFYLAEMRRQGWEPVHPSAHPNWVPKGYDKPNIVRGGLILMERPIELTKEARAETDSLTIQRQREAEQRLGMTPRDTLTRSHPDLGNRVTKEWGRSVPVIEQ